MLTTLRIDNLAIIDRLELEFAPGLNVLTGETGAGKSIIVGALDLVLGARAASESVRHGADEGRVEALFDIGARQDVAEALDAAGIPTDGGEMLVRRVLSRAGRNRIYINGALATLQTLARATGPLVDLVGQHEQYGLLDAGTHQDILDAFGDPLASRAELGAGYRELAALRDELALLTREDVDRGAREDYLRFQLDEIDEAQLRPGEDGELRQEIVRLRNAEELRCSAAEVGDLLYEGRDAAVGRLERARGLLARLADIDASAAPLAERLEQARIEVEDIAYEARAYRDSIEADPRRLQEVDDRLDTIGRLARKHGATVTEMLARRDELAAELGSLSNASERRGEVESAVAAREAELLTSAQNLSGQRRAAAQRLEKAVHESLAALDMERCRVRVGFLERPPGVEALGPTGIDRVELRVATNVGEGYQPLARIASGGELSRILLALKRAFTRSASVATYVFDEIDAGIGGAVAETVGRLLAETAAGHQVLCITHLPQVASFGGHHFRVEKQEREGRTVTRVLTLDRAGREEEIARMLGGREITKKTRAAAAEMIRLAERAAKAT